MVSKKLLACLYKNAGALHRSKPECVTDGDEDWRSGDGSRLSTMAAMLGLNRKLDCLSLKKKRERQRGQKETDRRRQREKETQRRV